MIPLIKRREITECEVCQKPLGSDSRDEGFTLCHEHRLCSCCGQDLTPSQIALCYEWAYNKALKNPETAEEARKSFSLKDVVILHPKCDLLNVNSATQTISQVELNYLNDMRLALIPDFNLSMQADIEVSQVRSKRLLQNMDFDQLCRTLEKWRACLEVCQTTFLLDPSYRRGVLKDRQKEDFDKVLQARSRSAEEKEEKKKQPSLRERYDKVQPLIPKAKDTLSLEVFLASHTLTDPDTAKELHKLWRNGILSLTKLGASEEEAIKQADASLIKNKQVK